MSYPIERFDKQIIIQTRDTADADRDTIGGFPYGWTDYLLGDGNGIAAYMLDPSAEDILEAARHHQETTHTIIVRYDTRIKPRMRVKLKTGESEYAYFTIKTVEDEKFQHRFMIIHAKQTTEEALED